MTHSRACVRCSRDADVEIASMWLCLECYHVAGSTCAGVLPAREDGAQTVDPVC